jgi:hypothetical protein
MKFHTGLEPELAAQVQIDPATCEPWTSFTEAVAYAIRTENAITVTRARHEAAGGAWQTDDDGYEPYSSVYPSSYETSDEEEDSEHDEEHHGEDQGGSDDQDDHDQQGADDNDGALDAQVHDACTGGVQQPKRKPGRVHWAWHVAK